MERERFRQIKALLRRRGRRRKNRGQRYTDGTIVEVYFYSVICDRPVVWACDPSHWPPGLRRGRLPSQPVMSRRLRTASVRALIDAVERLANPPADRPALVSVVDGKALPIALHSADRQSGKGRGVGNIARGYKIHAIIDAAGRLLAWRLAPLSRDEKAMAQRLVREIPPCATSWPTHRATATGCTPRCPDWGCSWWPRGGAARTRAWGTAGMSPGVCGARNCWRRTRPPSAPSC